MVSLRRLDVYDDILEPEFSGKPISHQMPDNVCPVDRQLWSHLNMKICMGAARPPSRSHLVRADYTRYL